jgi:sulfate adenylyltransferase
MPEVRIKDLPPPHGGKIVERIVCDPQMAMKLMQKCSAVYDIKPTLF